MKKTVTFSSFSPQGAVYSGLMKTLQSGTFVHAYLVSGPVGVGKHTLTELLTLYMLCQGENKPCGECPACRQVISGNHPDVVTLKAGVPLSPDTAKGRKTIPVEDVRYAINMVAQHTYEGGRRVVVVDGAEKMTPQAANCLLKTLEEPTEGNIFFLITDKTDLLLPTIISRCRMLKLHPWPDNVIRGILEEENIPSSRIEGAIQIASGSIGRALEIAGDDAFWNRRNDIIRDFFSTSERSRIIEISNQWKERKDDADELLDEIEEIIRSMLLVRLGLQKETAVHELPSSWQKAAKNADIQLFTELLDLVSDARRQRASQVTWQAIVEKLLLRIMEENIRWQK